MANGLQKYTVAEANNITLGQGGVAFLSGTAIYTPPDGQVVIAIQFIEDTVLDVSANKATCTLAADQIEPSDSSLWATDDQGGPGTGAIAINQTSLLAGMTIYGRWKQVAFDSGKALLYLG